MKTDQHSNFWFGFAIGACAAGAVAYAFGTKQGRSIVKKAMETGETLAEQHHDIEEMVTNFAKKIQNQTKTTENSAPSPLRSIGSIMDKMKHKVEPSRSKTGFLSK